MGFNSGFKGLMQEINLLVPISKTKTFFKKSNNPFDALCASRTRPNSESQEGGGAEKKKCNGLRGIIISVFQTQSQIN